MGLRRDWTFDLGEDWPIELVCSEADGVTVLDITSASVRWRGAGAEVTGVIRDGPAGLVTLTAPGAQTAGLTAGQHSYTVRVTLADGRISDQLFGFITARATEFAPA